MLTWRKLPLTLAFAVLVALAFGVGCRGFFKNPTMTSFTISPTNPTVPLGGMLQIHAFGIDSDNNQMGDVTSRITWSSAAPGTISVSTKTPGLLTGVALSTSTVTITGSFQALTPQTTNASVCVENGTNFKIVPANATLTGTTTQDYTASADASVGGVQTTVDITSAIQWTSGNTAVINIAGGTDPAVATTIAPNSNTTVLITATYTCNGTTNTFTTNVTVQP